MKQATKLTEPCYSSAMAALLLATVLTISPARADETINATRDADGVQHVSILGGSYFFKPDHIIVKAHVPVELSVSVEPGIIPHSFVLQSDEAKISINADLSTTPAKFVFTPAATGKFPFYCSHELLFFESHREQGMEGVLEVVE
ncbi:MAG: quinol oxidase [Azovibrio sp.]